jgi:hypothetical protein
MADDKVHVFWGGEIFTLLLSYVVPVKSKVKISQNFVAFSEYMNFKASLKWILDIIWPLSYLCCRPPLLGQAFQASD